MEDLPYMVDTDYKDSSETLYSPFKKAILYETENSQNITLQKYPNHQKMQEPYSICYQ